MFYNDTPPEDAPAKLQILGEAVRDFLVAIGIANSDAPIDGPTLLMFLKDAEDMIKSERESK